MESMILSMMLWVSTQTGIPVTEAPVIFSVDNIMVCDHMGAPAAHCSQIGRGIMATYDDNNRAIVMREEVMAEIKHGTILGLSTLVHEIVHHMQGKDKTMACREEQAYRLQEKWANERGTSVVDPFVMAMVAARCFGMD